MQGKDLTVYFITIGVMIVLVMGVGVAIYVLRGRLFGEEKSLEADAGSVLETMRAMRDRGEIAEEEYRAAQAALVAKATARREQPAPGAAAATIGIPSKTRTSPPDPGELRARPGFDLTGEPLPRPPGRDNDQTGRAGR